MDIDNIRMRMDPKNNRIKEVAYATSLIIYYDIMSIVIINPNFYNVSK